MASNVHRVQTGQELKQVVSKVLNTGALIVLNFWASWAEPCQQMNAVFEELAGKFPATLFFSIEAENAVELAEQFNVDSVPYFVLLKARQTPAEVGRVNGANPQLLSNLVREHSLSQASLPLSNGAQQEKTSLIVTDDLPTRLRKLTTATKCVAFIKGTRSQPRCGFTRQLIELFDKHNIDYSTFNILADEDVRQGLKTYSNWPTYPQVYVDGELIGGLDILKEMTETGELTTTLPLLQVKDTSKTLPLEERLRSLISRAPRMLFMKGSPDAPQCGFSRQIIKSLKNANVDFDYFDILTDEDVRQGLKTFSNWPTYPQLYVKGELIGGLDIVKELEANGELQEALKI